MIDRYSRAAMRNIWTEKNKFQAYLEVEILAAEAWSTLVKNHGEEESNKGKNRKGDKYGKGKRTKNWRS